MPGTIDGGGLLGDLPFEVYNPRSREDPDGISPCPAPSVNGGILFPRCGGITPPLTLDHEKNRMIWLRLLELDRDG
jgi:hypothetical protein